MTNAPRPFRVGSRQSTIFAATLTLLCAPSMQAQTQIERTQSAPGVYRVKPGIDVRDWGVDCTGTNDAAAILNSHTNVQDGISGERISIPNGCIMKLTTDQWQIYGSQGWEIEGVAILARNPLIEYCGPSGRDSVLKIERSGGWRIKGVNIQDGGAGCRNTTPNGVVVDNDRSGGYTTTDGLFDRVYVSPRSPIKNWTGINIAPVSRSNVEDMRFINSLIGCANSPGGVGVYLGSSFNAKMEDFQHTQIVQCPGGGIYQYNGGMLLRGMDTYGNKGDIVLGPGSDPTLIEEIISESPQMITTSGAANYPTTIVSSHVGWSGDSTGLCGIDLTHAFNGQYVFIGDSVDKPLGRSPGFPLCATTSSNLTMIGTQFGTGNGAVASGNVGFILPNGKNFGGTYSLFNGGRLRMGNGANYVTEDIGYGFFTQYGAELAGYGFNAQSLEDGHVPGTLSIGHDVMYIGNQNITFKGMWPIPMQSIYCNYTGATGSTQWSVEVFPKDAAGNRGGLISLNGRQCGSGAARLDASDYLTIVWPRVTSAVSYDVVLVNPADISQGLLFANVSDPGSGSTATTKINSGSTGSTFSYSYPNYYDSAITTINGESLIVNAPPTFTSAVTLPALNLTTTYISAASPTILSGFGASSTIVHSNGTAVFTINVGTGAIANSGVIGMPRAKNGWAVHCDDVTTQSTSVFVTKQTATSTTSATITQYSASATGTPWSASDVLVCQAAAY